MTREKVISLSQNKPENFENQLEIKGILDSDQSDSMALSKTIFLKLFEIIGKKHLEMLTIPNKPTLTENETIFSCLQI